MRGFLGAAPGMMRVDGSRLSVGEEDVDVDVRRLGSVSGAARALVPVSPVSELDDAWSDSKSESELSRSEECASVVEDATFVADDVLRAAYAGCFGVAMCGSEDLLSGRLDRLSAGSDDRVRERLIPATFLSCASTRSCGMAAIPVRMSVIV